MTRGPVRPPGLSLVAASQAVWEDDLTPPLLLSFFPTQCSLIECRRSLATSKRDSRIDIAIDLQDILDEDTRAYYLDAILSTIFPYSSQWIGFQLRAAFTHEMAQILQALAAPKNLSNLGFVKIDATANSLYHPRFPIPGLDYTGRPSNIVNLELNGVRICSQQRFNFPHLARLVIANIPEGIHWTRLRAILTAAPVLYALALDTFIIFEPPGPVDFMKEEGIYFDSADEDFGSDDEWNLEDFLGYGGVEEPGVSNATPAPKTIYPSMPRRGKEDNSSGDDLRRQIKKFAEHSQVILEKLHELKIGDIKFEEFAWLIDMMDGPSLDVLEIKSLLVDDVSSHIGHNAEQYFELLEESFCYGVNSLEIQAVHMTGQLADKRGFARRLFGVFFEVRKLTIANYDAQLIYGLAPYRDSTADLHCGVPFLENLTCYGGNTKTLREVILPRWQEGFGLHELVLINATVDRDHLDLLLLKQAVKKFAFSAMLPADCDSYDNVSDFENFGDSSTAKIRYYPKMKYHSDEEIARREQLRAAVMNYEIS